MVPYKLLAPELLADVDEACPVIFRASRKGSKVRIHIGCDYDENGHQHGLAIFIQV